MPRVDKRKLVVVNQIPHFILYEGLLKIGLNKQAAYCYAELCENGSASASQLAVRLGITQTGLYRVLDYLVVRGFAKRIGHGPSYYYPEQIDTALVNLAEFQRQQVVTLIKRHRAQQIHRFTRL